MEFEKKLTLFIYNFMLKHNLLNKLFKSISKVSQYIFFIVYIFNVIYTFLFLRKNLFLLLFIPFITILSNFILRNIFKRFRPFSTLKVENSLNHSNNYSFPSNHSTASMIIAFSTFPVNNRFSFLLIFFSIITGISRITTCTHYFTDVLAGWIIGIAFGIIFTFV